MRPPLAGSMYTLWVDEHKDQWAVHCFMSHDQTILFLTEGLNFKVKLCEWDELAELGMIRYLGWNHLYQSPLS